MLMNGGLKNMAMNLLKKKNDLYNLANIYI